MIANKIFTKIHIILFYLIAFLFFYIALCNSSNISAQTLTKHYKLTGGFKTITLSNTEFAHDTHPDDPFLSNANVSGSAGTTDVNGRLGYISIGVGYTNNFSKSYSYNFDLGFLFGNKRDIQKNVNDTRPPDNAAFIYSEINWGIYSAFDVYYHVEKFYAGVEVQLGGVFVESGWDRFNSDQSVQNKLTLVPTIGPKIGFYFIEASVQFGKNVDYGIQGVFRF